MSGAGQDTGKASDDAGMREVSWGKELGASSLDCDWSDEFSANSIHSVLSGIYRFVEEISTGSHRVAAWLVMAQPKATC